MPRRVRSNSQIIGITTPGINNPGGKQTHSGVLSASDRNMTLGFGGHYGYPRFPDMGNVGGPFILLRSEMEAPPVTVLISRGNLPTATTYSEYSGGINVNIPYPAMPSGGVPDSRSAEAWHKMKPTKPSWSGLNALAELRDLPRTLKQSFEIPRKGYRTLSDKRRGRESTLRLKDVADYHLAMQFGWLPLLSDCLSFYQAQKNLEKRIDWLVRNNGKPVRTSCSLTDGSSDRTQTVTSSYGHFQQVFPTSMYWMEPRATRTEWTSERWWASARFRFHLPSGPGGVVYKGAMRRALMGMRISPAVIYNAIPWTWLIDWFSNAGYLIENLDIGVADRLAADYCYIMRQVTNHRRIDVNGEFHFRGSSRPVTAHATASASSMRRNLIAPFGPSVGQGNLSLTQLSILGALGISKI